MGEVRMLIAGGGTGGHLFPGLAVADEFTARDPGHKVLFVGTDHGIEARAVPRAGYQLATIPSQGIAGKGAAAKLSALLVIPRGIAAAISVIRKFKPHVALGVGGYVSGPAILAARLAGVPAAIHEQNAAPGFTNRILARVVQAVFVSFEPAAAWFRRMAKKGRLFVTGNPARKELVQSRPEYEKIKARTSGSLFLLVVGGSQGAHGINVRMTDAVRALPDGLRKKLRIRHQSGERDFAEVKAGYEKLGVDAEVVTFIHDMSSAYAEADLIVSRSGAGAVAEIALFGLPSILIPFPHAISDHQAINASVLAESGAALLMREEATTGEDLAKTLAELIEDKERLAKMAAEALKSARPRAAADIVDRCLELVEKKYGRNLLMAREK